MANPLKAWREARRDTTYWKKARDRSASMREAEIVSTVDLALMSAGQALTRYRQFGEIGRDSQLDQLREVRLHLEASLGMLENIIP